MKRFKPHLFALVFISAWGLSAWCWMGSEDGSSGFTVLGWVLASFVIPVAHLIGNLKSAHSNADLPLIFAASWLLYSSLAIIFVELALILRKRFHKHDNAA